MPLPVQPIQESGKVGGMFELTEEEQMALRRYRELINDKPPKWNKVACALMLADAMCRMFPENK